METHFAKEKKTLLIWELFSMRKPNTYQCVVCYCLENWTNERLIWYSQRKTLLYAFAFRLRIKFLMLTSKGEATEVGRRSWGKNPSIKLKIKYSVEHEAHIIFHLTRKIWFSNWIFGAANRQATRFLNERIFSNALYVKCSYVCHFFSSSHLFALMMCVLYLFSLLHTLNDIEHAHSLHQINYSHKLHSSYDSPSFTRCNLKRELTAYFAVYEQKNLF